MKIRNCLFLLILITSCAVPKGTQKLFDNDTIQVGAERLTEYLPLLKGKNIGLVVNQTSIVGKARTHVLDTLLRNNVKVVKILAPEHGFRGVADAGEKVDNTIDAKTGIPIISIYGQKRKPDATDLKNIDVLIFDIQDVGARFYTYISTLQYIMESAAENKIPLIIFDRPNPNGHYVDGPVLNDKSLRTFIGMQAIPVVHGMTMGEYAQMLNTERWLENNVKADLTVIKCKNYDHTKFYELPVKPSPNIPNITAVYLYPSICYFEGTDVSLGRGTNKQFQVIGSPNFPKEKAKYSFTPQPNEGAKTPPQQGIECFGFDLSNEPISVLQKQKGINLKHLIYMYQNFPDKDKFFLKSNFFDKLAGNYTLREQLKAGKTEAEIKKSWEEDLNKFKMIRKKYLLYNDFQ